MGFTANKKIIVLGVANKKDLYFGTEGVHTKQNMSTPTYEVAHLKCVKRLISSAVL